jgi:hypothetical protein
MTLPCSVWRESPCTFEQFLSQWNTGWLVFKYGVHFHDDKPYQEVPYDKLNFIVFTDRFHFTLVDNTCMYLSLLSSRSIDEL